MKMKKLVSAIAALALSVSAFAGIASAEYTSVYERGTTTAWSDADAAEWVASGTTTTISGGVSVTGTNTAYSATKDVSALINENDIVRVTGTYVSEGAPGRAGSYGYVKIGEDVELRADAQNKASSIVIDGTATDLETSGRSATFTFDVTVDTQLKAVTSCIINGTERISASTTVTNGTVNNITIGHYRGGREGYATTNLLSAIEISTEAQAAAATADYTINYTSGDTVVKTTTGTTVVGQTVDAEAVVYDEAGAKYFADAASLVITSDATTNVLNVPVTAAAAISEVTVNYVAGDTTVYSETKAVTGYEQDVVRVGYKKYVIVDGTLYEAAKGSAAYYGADVTLATDAALNVTVSAVALEGTPIAVVETSGDTANYADVRASEGSAARGETISFGTVQPGVYSIETISYIRGNDTHVYLDGELLCDLVMHSGSWGVETTTDITVTKAGELTIASGGSGTDYVDCALLVKTGDYEEPIPTEFEGVVEFVSSYEESDTVEGNATALKATFNALGYSFNTLTFTVTAGEVSKTETKTLETTVTDKGDVVYGLIIDGAIVAAKDVTAVATLVELE